MDTIECPRCKHRFDPGESDDGDGWSQDDKRDFDCPKCGRVMRIRRDFEVWYELDEEPPHA